MGREIRMVAPHWEHPKNDNGHYIPLHGTSYKEAAEEWIKGFHEWKPTDYAQYYWEYDTPPSEDDHVSYCKEDATWYQVYETVSEGTPVTPPFETQQQLIDHLVEFGESLNPYNTDKISRQAAESFVLETQWVPSMVVCMSSNGVAVRNGIEICGD